MERSLHHKNRLKLSEIVMPACIFVFLNFLACTFHMFFMVYVPYPLNVHLFHYYHNTILLQLTEIYTFTHMKSSGFGFPYQLKNNFLYINL